MPGSVRLQVDFLLPSSEAGGATTLVAALRFDSEREVFSSCSGVVVVVGVVDFSPGPAGVEHRALRSCFFFLERFPECFAPVLFINVCVFFLSHVIYLTLAV